MVAAPQRHAPVLVAPLAAGRARSPARHRAVGITVSPVELLRPASDLARLVAGFGHADVLVAASDAPPVPIGPAGSRTVELAAVRDQHEHRGSGGTGQPGGVRDGGDPAGADPAGGWTGWDESGSDLSGWDDSDWDEDAASGDGELDDDDPVLDGVARLGHPSLRLHRLGLRPPLGRAAEGDLVAALSELVGFDPEAGVYCLAPSPAPGDPGRGVVSRAAERIAMAYGIPLLRYRCLELSVVGDDPHQAN